MNEIDVKIRERTNSPGERIHLNKLHEYESGASYFARVLSALNEKYFNWAVDIHEEDGDVVIELVRQ